MAQSGSNSSGIYVVRSGDSVRSIAAALGIPAMELCRVNGLQPGAALKPGQKLRLPQLSRPDGTAPPPPDRSAAMGATQTIDLRHMQTQLIQLPKLASPRPAQGSPLSPEDTAAASVHAARMAKRSRLDPRDIAAQPPARTGDLAGDSSEIRLINPFSAPPRSRPPAERQRPPAASEPPATPAGGAPAAAEDEGRREPRPGSRLTGRRRQKAGLPGATDVLKKPMLLDPAHSRDAARTPALPDPGAEADDSFRHLDERGAGGRGGSDQFRSLSGRPAGASGGDQFRMAGTGAAVAGGDRFSSGARPLGEDESDSFRRYFVTDPDADETAEDAGESPLSGDSPLRRDQLRIGDTRLALPSSLMTQSLNDPKSTDELFRRAVEGAIEPGKNARIVLGPGLPGPETSLRELDGFESEPVRLDVLRGRDGRLLAQLAFQGYSPRWAPVQLSEAYQFNPDHPGDLTRLFLLLSRPQPLQFLEKLRLVRREAELGALPPRGEDCFAFGLHSGRSAAPGAWPLRWLDALQPAAGAIRAWEEARADQIGLVQYVPLSGGLARACAEPFAGRSLDSPGPSELRTLWHGLVAGSFDAAQARFLHELAGHFEPDERMVAIRWVHAATAAPCIEVRLVLSETWSRRVRLNEPFRAPAGTRLEICWSAGSPRWTQRPRAVDALWRTLAGQSDANELQMSETFAASFFRQGTLSLWHHAAGRKPFAEFARSLLAEARTRGESAGQSQGRAPSQLFSAL
jgi:LysM repeat protein